MSDLTLNSSRFYTDEKDTGVVITNQTIGGLSPGLGPINNFWGLIK